MPVASLFTMWMSAPEADTEGSLVNKAYCIVDEDLARSCYLNFISLMQNLLAVLCD